MSNLGIFLVIINLFSVTNSQVTEVNVIVIEIEIGQHYNFSIDRSQGGLESCDIAL